VLLLLLLSSSGFFVSLNAALSLAGVKFTSLWPEMIAAWFIKLSPIIDAILIYELMRRSVANTSSKKATVVELQSTRMDVRADRGGPLSPQTAIKSKHKPSPQLAQRKAVHTAAIASAPLSKHEDNKEAVVAAPLVGSDMA
jgi:hypothetical protein